MRSVMPPKKTPAKPKPPDEILSFDDAAAFDRWLREHHATSPGVMVHMGKKGHPPFVTHEAALDAALRWGWIDSVRRSHDATSFVQRFSRRTSKSPWSQVNVGKVEAMIAEGRMMPPGQAEIDRAKADGRWDRAYASPKNATVPDDFAAARGVGSARAAVHQPRKARGSFQGREVLFAGRAVRVGD